MTEREFQKNVIELAKTLGYRVAHFDASVRVVGKERTFVGDRSSAGFPDLVMVRRGRLIFAELKADKGTLRANQLEWLDDLAEATETYVWYPSDWDKISQILQKKGVESES